MQQNNGGARALDSASYLDSPDVNLAHTVIEISESAIPSDSGRVYCLLNTARPASQKIDQNELRKIARIREVSLAICHGGHLLDELNQVVIACEHECIDHDPGFAAGLDLLESFRHHEWIATHGVLI